MPFKIEPFCVHVLLYLEKQIARVVEFQKWPYRRQRIIRNFKSIIEKL